MQNMYWKSADDPVRLRIAPPAPAISKHYSTLDNSSSFRQSNQVYDPAFPLDVQPPPSSAAPLRWNSFDLEAEERNLKARLSSSIQHQSNSSNSFDRHIDDYYMRETRSDSLSDPRLTENVRRAPPLQNEDFYFRRPQKSDQDDVGMSSQYRISKPTITDDDIHDYLESRRRHERALIDDSVPSRMDNREQLFRQHRDDNASLDFFSRTSRSTSILANTIDDDRFNQRMNPESHQPNVSNPMVRIAPPEKPSSSQFIHLDDIPEEGKIVDVDSSIPRALFRRKVTHVDGTIGFAGTDVFFQTSKVSGSVLPQVGSLVLIKAEKMHNMPFQWSALSVELISLYPPNEAMIRSSSTVVTTTAPAGRESGQNRVQQNDYTLDTIPLNLPTIPSTSHVPPLSTSTEKPLKSILKNKPPPPPIISATRGGTWRASTPSPKPNESPDIIFEKAIIDKRKRSPSPRNRRTGRSSTPTKSRSRGGERSPRRRSRSISPRRRSRSPRKRSSISPRRRSITSPRRRSRSPKRSRYSKSPPSSSSRYRRERLSRSRSPSSRQRPTITKQDVSSVNDRSTQQARSPSRPLMSPPRRTVSTLQNKEKTSSTTTTTRPNLVPVAPAKKPSQPVSFKWTASNPAKAKLPIIGKKPNSSKKPKEQPKAFIVVSEKSSKDDKIDKETPKKDEEAKKKITNEIVKNIQQVREKLKNDKILSHVTLDRPTTVVPNPLFSTGSASQSIPTTTAPQRPVAPYSYGGPNMTYPSNDRSHPPPFYPQQPVSYPPISSYPQHQGYNAPMYPPHQQQPQRYPPPLLNFNNRPFMPPGGSNSGGPYYNNCPPTPILEPTHVRRTTVLSTTQGDAKNSKNNSARPSSGNLVLLKNPWPQFNSKAQEPLPPGEEANKLSKATGSKITSTTTVSATSSSTNVQNSKMEQQKKGSSDSSSTIDSLTEVATGQPKMKRTRRGRGRKRKKTNGAEENWDVSTAEGGNSTQGATVNETVGDDDEVCVISVKPAAALFEREYLDQPEADVKHTPSKVNQVKNVVAESSKNTVQSSNPKVVTVDKKKIIAHSIKSIGNKTAQKNTTTTQPVASESKGGNDSSASTSQGASSKINEDVIKSWEKERLDVKAKKREGLVESNEKKESKPSSSNISGGSSTNSRLSDKLTDAQKMKLLEKEKETAMGSVNHVKPSTTTGVKKSIGEIRGLMDTNVPPHLVNKKLPPLSYKLSQKSRENLHSQILRDEKEKLEHRLGASSNVLPTPVYYHGGNNNSSSNFRPSSPSRQIRHHQIANVALQEPVIRICRRRSLSPSRQPTTPHHHHPAPFNNDHVPFSVDPMRAFAVKQLEIKSLELRDRELQYKMKSLLVERESFDYNAPHGDHQRYF